MRRLYACVLLLALAAFAGAKPGDFVPSENAVRAAVEQTVSGQLAAFRRDDYAAAREFASTPFRERFPPVEFETMVRRGYPRIAANRAGRVGELLDDGQRALARVTVVDRDGVETVFRYVLAKEGERWLVAGLAEATAPRADT